MKTLLLALLSPGKSNGTREGAIRGLIGVGKEAVRKGIIEGGGARVVERECIDWLSGGMAGEEGEEALVNSVMDALSVLRPTSATATTTAPLAIASSQDMDVDAVPPIPLDLSQEEDHRMYERLTELIGESFAEKVRNAGERKWVLEIVGVSSG